MLILLFCENASNLPYFGLVSNLENISCLKQNFDQSLHILIDLYKIDRLPKLSPIPTKWMRLLQILHILQKRWYTWTFIDFNNVGLRFKTRLLDELIIPIYLCMLSDRAIRSNEFNYLYTLRVLKLKLSEWRLEAIRWNCILMVMIVFIYKTLQFFG